MKEWARSFYFSKEWKTTQAAFLESKEYLCERCSTPSQPVLAKIAHHKTYLTKYNIHNPYISLSWDNLEALCQNCHNKEHHKAKSKINYHFDKDGNLIDDTPPIKNNQFGGKTTEGGG